MFAFACDAVRTLSVGVALAGWLGACDILAGEPTRAFRPKEFTPPANARPSWQPKRPSVAAAAFYGDEEQPAEQGLAANDEPQPDEAVSGMPGVVPTPRDITRVQMSCDWESGLKWRVRHPSEFATAQQMSGRSTTVVARAIHLGSERAGGSQIRQVSQLELTDPFHDPFGDKVARHEAEDEPESTSPMPLNAPKPATNQFQPRGTTRRDQPATTEEELAPRPESDPPATLRMPESAGPAADGKRIYNDRNCGDEEGRCAEVRKRVRSIPLTRFGPEALDITPSLRPRTNYDAIKQTDDWKSKLDLAPPRTWHDREGAIAATGKFADYVHGRVAVRGADGESTRIPFANLSDDDMCFVNAWWGLPSECKMGDEKLASRSWTPATMTWKASALGHKPLYFEETQLERYGHSMGPLAQPVVSGAHFFLNIAVLPYKMGIHPMSECQYALGYYRPGSCAPWLLPPIPISLRGALAESAVVLGGIYVIP